MIYTLLAVYFLSAFFSWRYLHIAHNKGGRWYKVSAYFSDVLFVVTPLLNTLYCFKWVDESPKGIHNRDILLNKFFNIKD